MKKKYAFYCSGNAGRLLKFFETRNLNDFPVDLVFYDGGVTEISNKLNKFFGTNFIAFENKEGLHGKLLSESISSSLFHDMQIRKIDYLFCFGDKILKPPLIIGYKNKIINFHPSILPAFPGLNAIDKALSSSVQILGNTAHFIDDGIDTGPIILQTVMKRSFYFDYEDILKLQLPMLEKIWIWLEEDRILVHDKVVKIKSNQNQNLYFSSN
jgi:phosphoribosylglycinamide formyltransferase-1